MKRPSKETVLEMRLATGKTQRQAAAVIHRAPPRGGDRWSEWERGESAMPLCEFELFLLKEFHSPAERRKFLKG